MGERLRKLYVTIHMKLLCKILISIPVHLHWATRALQKSKPDHTILLVKRHQWPQSTLRMKFKLHILLKLRLAHCSSFISLNLLRGSLCSSHT